MSAKSRFRDCGWCARALAQSPPPNAEPAGFALDNTPVAHPSSHTVLSSVRRLSNMWSLKQWALDTIGYDENVVQAASSTRAVKGLTRDLPKKVRGLGGRSGGTALLEVRELSLTRSCKRVTVRRGQRM